MAYLILSFPVPQVPMILKITLTLNSIARMGYITIAGDMWEYNILQATSCGAEEF